MRILTNKQMRLADKLTIEGGVSGCELMRRAGEVIARSLPADKKIYIICGKGNNGGDGYSAAVVLKQSGRNINVFATDVPKGDSAVFAEQYKKCGGEIYGAEQCDFKCGVIVDCLFGTGFHGTVGGIYSDIIEKINASGAFVVSADIPSGLNGDNGRGKVCVQADMTIAIQAAKLGHFLGKGKDVCGKLIIEDIGIDCADLGAQVIDEEFCAKLFPPRRNDSNKGTYGRCAVIGGSKNYPGAIKLAEMGLSALQSGCGLCAIAAPDFLTQALAGVVVENTLFPLEDDGAGIRYNKEQIEKLCAMTKCIAIGPGIGNGYVEIIKLIADLLSRDIKLIIDADGLNCLASNISVLKGHKANVLVTPHPMEMARLAGVSLDSVLDAPLQVASDFAKTYGVTVLLKGSATIVTDGVQTYIMKDGGPYLAKGGSGDVLSGITTSLLAKHDNLLLRVTGAAYILGRSADLALQDSNEYSLISRDVVNKISDTISEIIKS